MMTHGVSIEYVRDVNATKRHAVSSQTPKAVNFSETPSICTVPSIVPRLDEFALS